ncbi:hypothetical protein SLUN_36485 [Streptomyces lunaelactis]|uniref:Uncharacterized protein n=1 Tax=Streptomyces lunaelactis TaxID=1535768 RepID=A0A2R4TCL1_9ACTN|nr:hypothetical protein [Streptomyces lunaelactis]AVZ76866.1 hypothetical protein SLUN_36485 [Streptomyces lunaelactis]NUK04927.1 hypothetical protein [Streptomyces lunaelactis]NUK12980.1 hypothetical protein [Streptomyces lunaelactis]NUK13731.1 hypothetical protein [Streptomyces lunaelactis]NUK21628.1 hypothetical protein [Streptomyces lunaelactis]
MSWASWTTGGIYAGAGGVLTEEVGVIKGDLTVHTTWSDGEAQIAVQFSGSSDWFTLTGSPVPCPSEEASRTLHQSVVEAVRAEAAAPVSLGQDMVPPA